VAISADNGVEHISYFRRSLDADDFVKYLKELRVKLGDEKVCLFMDQLSVHRSYKARDKMTELGFKWLFNAAYYPDGNGIELIFAQVKLKFKKMRVQAILNGKRDRARV
jgi:transposase